MSKIDQKENYQASFGYCYRSSSIFWVSPVKIAKTYIILSNYRSFKNNLEVSLIASWRRKNGNLIKREKLTFGDNNIKVIEAINELSEEGGSIEIETFSYIDLRIPYSAIMATYETLKSITMVHSYTRIYSNHEIEEKRLICDGHEGCWTLRDSKEIYSFGGMCLW